MLRCLRSPLLLVVPVALGACSNGPGSAEAGAFVDAGSERSGPAASPVSGGPTSDSVSTPDAPSDGSSASGMPGSSAGSPMSGATVGAGGGNGGEALPSGGPAPSGKGGASSSGGSSSSGGFGGAQRGPSSGGSSTGEGTGDGGRSPSTAGAGSATGGGPGPGQAPEAGGASSSGGAATGGTAGSEGTVAFATCPDTTWKLVWGDDFDGAAGTAVDGSSWAYDSGPNWYNGELQDYTTGTDNASLDGNGNLVIEARKEAREGRQYTSARLKTEGKRTFTYGRVEARMKLPSGQGMWPAFWMLGGNSWPADGEIDIVENLGREPSIAHGTMHGPGYSGADGPSGSFTLPGGAAFSDDFHIFAVEWEASAIRWYVDGELYSTKTSADIGGNRWVFDHPFFIILNLAVGGDWPGNPDDTTVFPQRLLVDYIHVCEQ